MEWLAIAVSFSVCLYFIDKNQKWAMFRRVLKWGAVALLALTGVIVLWLNPEWRQWLVDNATTIPALVCFVVIGLYVLYLASVGWRTLGKKNIQTPETSISLDARRLPKSLR